MFQPKYNYQTKLFTIYFNGKEFSSFTYTTREEALAKASDLQQHFSGGR